MMAIMMAAMRTGRSETRARWSSPGRCEGQQAAEQAAVAVVEVAPLACLLRLLPLCSRPAADLPRLPLLPHQLHPARRMRTQLQV